MACGCSSTECVAYDCDVLDTEKVDGVCEDGLGGVVGEVELAETNEGQRRAVSIGPSFTYFAMLRWTKMSPGLGRTVRQYAGRAMDGGKTLTWRP